MMDWGCLSWLGAVDLIYFILQVIWHNGNNDNEIGFLLLKKVLYFVHKYLSSCIQLSGEVPIIWLPPQVTVI